MSNNISKSETARINGAKSRGPITEEGRARSSRNSLRHGFTAKAVVLAAESRPEYQALLDSFLDRFQPADAVEQELVEAMAAARWRLRRLRAIESSILEVESLRQVEAIDGEFTEIDDTDRLAHAFTCLSDNGHSLALLIRYESALNRTFDRALKQLLLLQSAPRPESPVGSFRNPPSQPDPLALASALPIRVDPCSSVSQTLSPTPVPRVGPVGSFGNPGNPSAPPFLSASTERPCRICVHPRPKGLSPTPRSLL